MKHGAAARGRRAPIYDTWVNMTQRCYNRRHPSWRRYGGRGIRVCARWRRSFTAFVLDMGPRPRGATLERKKNNGNYTPGNCTWATRSEQQFNRRTNVLLTFRGRTQPLKKWAREIGLSHVTLRTRVLVLKWSTRRALTTPPLHTGNRFAKRRAFRGPKEGT